MSEVQGQFQRQLPHVDWMDEHTKKLAIDKVKAVTNKIGFPELVKNVPELDKKYKKMDVDPINAFVNVKHALRFYTEDYLSQRGQPVDKNRYGLSLFVYRIQG